MKLKNIFSSKPGRIRNSGEGDNMGYLTMGNSKKSAENYNSICAVKALRLRQEKRRVEARVQEWQGPITEDLLCPFKELRFPSSN